MKRNKNLFKLSHDHHHALVFCSRLRTNAEPVEGKVLNYIAEFAAHSIVPHFELEEQLLLPHLSDVGLRKRLQQEHASIMKRLSESLTGAEVHKHAGILSAELNAHIRFEERIMFPWLEQNLSEYELEHIGRELNRI